MAELGTVRSKGRDIAFSHPQRKSYEVRLAGTNSSGKVSVTPFSMSLRSDVAPLLRIAKNALPAAPCLSVFVPVALGDSGPSAPCPQSADMSDHQ